MTEPEYFRVNVSTATSTPTYDEATGERKAEVDMLLPSNLINVADKVERAEMAVMKMKVPLALIPSAEIPIRPEVNYSPSAGFVQTTGVIGIYPAYITENNRNIVLYDSEDELYPIKKSSIDVLPVYLTPQVKTKLAGGSSMKEKKIGVHSFDSITEFLECLSRALNAAVENAIPKTNYLYNGTLYNGLPLNTCFQFLLNSDNTITLRAIMVTDSGRAETNPIPGNKPVRGCIIPEGGVQYLRKRSAQYPDDALAVNTVFYTEGYETEQWISDEGSFVSKPAHIEVSYPQSHPMRIFIACNRVIRDLLPCLPWIRKISDPTTDSSRYGDEFFLLDTTQAVVEYHQDYVMSKHLYVVGGTSVLPDGELDSVESFDHRYCAVDFKFIESDAVSISQVSSIVLTMNGAAFNQQVYPINFDQSEMSSAQTTTVPIIDVYYPLCTRPSDWTTDMIVVKSDFTNAGPVTINPMMLKERSIKFKLYYITASGEMREMLIPSGSPFIFQLCFALWVKKIKN